MPLTALQYFTALMPITSYKEKNTVLCKKQRLFWTKINIKLH